MWWVEKEILDEQKRTILHLVCWVGIWRYYKKTETCKRANKDWNTKLLAKLQSEHIIGELRGDDLSKEKLRVGMIQVKENLSGDKIKNDE